MSCASVITVLLTYFEITRSRGQWIVTCKCDKFVVLSHCPRKMICAVLDVDMVISEYEFCVETICFSHRTVLHVLWLKLLNLLISHPSSNLCTGSRSTNALNINSFDSPTKFLQPANLTTYTN